MYGDGLSRVNDIERNYRTTLSKTNLRSDRGDLRLYTFAGSNLHGGAPAIDRVQAPKVKGSTNPSLYAPIGEITYGRGYYDHLRATTPEPRKRSARSAPLMEEPEYTYTRPSRILTDTEYKTLPTRYSDLDSDLRGKTTTKTTTRTTESYVPLTTYIYHTPFHSYYYNATPFSSYTYRTADDLYSYNYVDDFKRNTTTTTKTTSKNVDALDLSMTSKYNYNSYVEKCSKIQSQLEEVNRWMSEAESKIKNEVVTSRSKIQADLAEVAAIVEDTAKYNDELQSAIRKQAKQISTLSSQYQDINRNISDVLETLDRSKSRCQTLQSELSSMQSSLTSTKTTKTVYTY